MPIDATIPLRAVQPRARQRDPMRDYGNMLQISEMQDQRTRRNAFDQAARGAIGPDGEIDYGALKGAMAQSGDIMGAVDLDTKLAGRSKARTDQEVAEYNLAKQRLGLIGQVFGQVRDPQSWARGRAFLGQQGIDISEIPEQFDPAFAQDAVRQSLTAAQQLDQMWKGKEYKLSERRTAATEREPLVEIADPDSPTGTRMVPRSQAAGMPGKPPSGLSIETGPDGSTRITQGRQGGSDYYTRINDKNLANHRQAIREAANSSRSTIFRIQQAKSLLDKTRTGSTANVRIVLKGLAKDMGLDLESLGITDDVSAAEALRSLGTQFALDFVQQTKGAVSNVEMGMFLDASVGLQRTPEGNRMILDLAQRVAERQIAVNRLATKYEKEHGRLDAGFDEVLEQYHDSNPLFTPEMQQQMQARTGGDSDRIPIPKPLTEMTTEELQQLLQPRTGQ